MWINSLAIDNGDLYINNLFADVQNGFAMLKVSQCIYRVDRMLLLISVSCLSVASRVWCNGVKVPICPTAEFLRQVFVPPRYFVSRC